MTIYKICVCSDSKFFKAYAECVQTVECKVTYSFTIKYKISDNQEYVTIDTEIKGKHVHESNNWVRSEDRVKLTQRINSVHKGFCYETNQHDIATGIEQSYHSLAFMLSNYELQNILLHRSIRRIQNG